MSGLYPPPSPTPVQPPPSQPPPPPAPAPAPVDAAAFVVDVTIPDGTTLSPGQSFTKTWRLRNTGTTTWGSGYRLAFVGGAPLGAPSTVAVPSAAPGNTADVSVPMAAPSGAGSYQGSWQLANAQGVRFGQTIWVKVTVSTPVVVTLPQAPAPPPPQVPPRITDLRPNPVPGSNTRQTVTLLGSGFAPGLTVTLRTGGQSYLIPPERTTVVSPTQVQILVDVTTVAAPWTAQASNPGGASSNLFSFSVVAPPPTPAPSPIAVPLPPINEIVEPLSLNLGSVQVGSCSGAYPFAVRNRVGAGTLSGSASTSSPFRIVSGSPFTVGAAQVQSIQIQFCPTAAGPVSGIVTFTTNGGTASRSVSGQGTSPMPTTGTVRIQATLDGSPWTGNVTTTLSGPASLIVGSVPAAYSDRATGTYTLNYSSGGPSGSRPPQISPSPTQSLGAGGTITFTLNFTAPPTPPVSPTSLSTIVLSASQINLSWQDNGNNETGFRIERRPINGSYTQIAMVGINNTNYADTGLAAGTGYCYRIRAFNNAGDSGNSNEACGTTLVVAQLSGTWVGTWRSSNTGAGGSMTLTIAQGGGNSLSGSAVLSGHAAPSSFSLAGNTSDGLQFQLVNTPPPITAAITGTLTGGMLQGNYQTLQDRGTFSLRR